MTRKSDLLIKEPPLIVLPSLARLIGLNEAIILQQLHYWLDNQKAGAMRNGQKWIFNTYEEWQENFPFWSISTIQRIFSNLEKNGIVVAAQLDAKSRDMRKYYRIDYDKLCMMQDSKLTLSNTPECDDVIDESEITSKTTSNFSETHKKSVLEKANQKVDAILQLEAQASQEKVRGWTYREKFSFNQDILDLADRCSEKFGPPSKRDLSLWIMEIGDWADFGIRAQDWARAQEIVAGFSVPILSVTGMTKALRAACLERKNPSVQPERPELKKYVPEEGQKYAPRPEHLARPKIHRSNVDGE